MGRKIHIIDSINEEGDAGKCRNCGEVPVIWVKGYARCKPSVIAQRDSPRRRTHGLNTAQSQEFKRDKVCEICGATNNLVVDHCHKTKKVRGCLCHNCNVALGHFKDSTLLLAKAIIYLKD